MRVVPRSVEATVGGVLLKLASQKALKDSKLVESSVDLPNSKITMYYLKRGPENASLTLLFCHGFSDQALNMAPFIASLQIPDNVRIIVPDCIGHGRDLERVRQEGSAFQQPSPQQQIDAMSELLDILQIKHSHAFGISMGGALAYFLRIHRPDVILKTVLVSPAIGACLDEDFVRNYKNGTNKFVRIDSRHDVKQLFRGLTVPHSTKKDPVPKFFLESIYRKAKRDVPTGHWETMMNILLEETSGVMNCSEDVDVDCERLVIWPQGDTICNYSRGKDFFIKSTCTTFQTIPNCGHLFLSDGTFLLDYIASDVSTFLLNKEECNCEEKALPS